MSTPGIIEIATPSPPRAVAGDVILVHGPMSGALHMVVVHNDGAVLYLARIDPIYLRPPAGRLARARRSVSLWAHGLWYRLGWLTGVR